MASDMPYEWGHPQFDTENALSWGDFVREQPYVETQGRVYGRPSSGD